MGLGMNLAPMQYLDLQCPRCGRSLTGEHTNRDGATALNCSNPAHEAALQTSQYSNNRQAFARCPKCGQMAPADKIKPARRRRRRPEPLEDFVKRHLGDD